MASANQPDRLITGEEMQRLGEADALEGEGTLEGFTLPVAVLFTE